MNLLLNKQLRNILFVSSISLCLASCSSDDKTSEDKTASALEKVESVATETLNTEIINKEKTVSQAVANKTKNEPPSESMLAHGEEAHKNHCYKCHTDEVYTRENRFVKSIDALSKQVLRCKEGNDVPWFDEDADAVVQFLNQKYYRF